MMEILKVSYRAWRLNRRKRYVKILRDRIKVEFLRQDMQDWLDNKVSSQESFKRRQEFYATVDNMSDEELLSY